MLTQKQILEQSEKDAHDFPAGATHQVAFMRGATWANKTLSAQIAELQAVNSEQAGKIVDLQARREEHLRTIAELMGEKKEFVETLQDLYDEQNGAPLTRREENWFQAYRKAGELLAKHTAK